MPSVSKNSLSGAPREREAGGTRGLQTNEVNGCCDSNLLVIFIFTPSCLLILVFTAYIMASLLPSTRFLLRRQLPRPFCEPNIRLFPLRPFHSSPFIASSDEFEGFTDTESVKTGPAAENGAKGKGKAKVTNDPKTWPEGWENDADFWPDFQEVLFLLSSIFYFGCCCCSFVLIF